MPYLVSGPIRLDALIAEAAAPDCGGTAVFLGTVRSGPAEAGQGRGGVTGIEYTAYEEMATAEFARIVGEARERWAGARIVVRHRLGLVPVGEPSIAIVAAAPHRAAAFEACRYVIEQTKQRLPVWKRELHADGAAVWVDADGHPSEGAPR